MTPSRTPEPAFRWVIVAAAAAMLAIAMGQLVNGLSAFLAPLEREFGATRGQVALVNTMGLVGLAIGGIVMGALADRVSIRAVVLAGAVMTGLCIAAASQVTALWQLHLLFLVAGALGGGALFAPLFALVGTWFRTGAGLAIGIVSAGQAIGQGGVPLANALLIESLGWRGAFLAVGLASLALLVPLALLARRPGARPGPAATTQPGPAAGGAAAMRPATVIATLSLAVLCCCSLMSVPLMHLAPLVQLCGIPAPEAAGVVMVMMLAAIAGRVAFGRLADMIGALPAYFAASAWQTALVVMFTWIDDLGLFYIFSPIYGFGYAGVMTGVLTTIRALTPLNRRAGATGIILAFAWIGHGLGGFLGGVFFDLTGSYDLSFAAAMVAGVVNLITIGALAWRVLRGPAGQATVIGSFAAGSGRI